MGVEVMLRNVRTSFMKTMKPEEGEYGKRWSSSFFFDQDSPAYEAMKKAVSKVLADQWPDAAKRPKGKLLCLRDGNKIIEDAEERGSEEAYQNYRDKYVVSASSKVQPPHFITKGKNVVELEEDDGTFYSGCYVNVKLDVWALDNPAKKGGKRVCAQIMGIQFYKDGDSLGGGGGGKKATANDFDPVEGDDMGGGEDDFDL